MEAQQADLKGVLDKIARLKALHARPGTEHEAQVAAGMITKLMLKYNLTQAQVDGAGVEATLTGAERFRYDLKRQRRYARSLMGVIARYNFGRTVNTIGSSNVWIFAREYNRDAIVELYEYLLPIMERLAREGYRAYVRGYDSVGYWDKPTAKGTWQTGFMYGFANGLAERLEVQKAWLESQQGGNNAIMLLTDEAEAAVQAFWAEGYEKAPARQVQIDREGYAAGRQAGRNVNLADRIR